MAITNHERVGKALDLLKDGLRPYVERELRAQYGGNWASEVKAMLNDTRLERRQRLARQRMSRRFL